MKKCTLILAFLLFVISGTKAATPRAKSDSLRVDTVLSTLKSLAKTVDANILPKLSGETKTSLAAANQKLKQSLKTAGTTLQQHIKSTFPKLTAAEKKIFTDLESQVSKMKSIVTPQSEFYHDIAVPHIFIYKATQEMTPDSKKPLVATYVEPYDPNTSGNHQVTILGAYMNFYLEYRITVGGIELGPDIVDADRLVFTFPDKLLAGLTGPTYIEIKAAPQMQTGTGKSAKVEPYKEQVTYLLVMPKKG